MTGQTHTDSSRSLGQITGDLLGNAQEIIRDEIRLAKAEIRSEAKEAVKGAGILIAGAVLALYTLGLVLATAIIALAIVMDLWLAALLVTAAVAVTAAILLAVGRSRIQDVEPKPDQTIDSVKENIEWTKQQVRNR